MSDDFASCMHGQFQGILHWSQLDALWERAPAKPQGGYASLAGEAAP